MQRGDYLKSMNTLHLSSTCCKLTPKSEQSYKNVLRYVEKLVSKGEVLYFKPGQVLVYEGHMPCGFFLLKRGHLNPEAPQDGLVGLVHLLSDSPYCATVTAKDEVEVIFFPKAAVLELTKKGK